MPKGWKLTSSPDRTSFATFVWAMKLKIFAISLRKSLEYVKKEKRQNLL
jgi:hypothetical protein